MSPIKFAIENPVKVAVAVILTVLFGSLSYMSTPVQLTPEVAEPEVTVTTRWPGASPQEIEREIIEEQEEQLKSVEGLREFKSESSDSQGVITLKFEVGTDITEAVVKINNKLNQVPEYPVDADKPVIDSVNTGNSPIAWFILKPISPTEEEMRAFLDQHEELRDIIEPRLTGDPEAEVSLPWLTKLSDAYPALDAITGGKSDPSSLRKFAEDFLEARLERVPGVANANVFGGREEEFHIEVDPSRLAAHKVTLSELRVAVQSQNKDTSGGDIWEGKSRNVIRTLGQFRSPGQVEETIVAMRDNTPIRVRDVATVGIAYKKPDGVVRQRGVEGLALNAQQASGSNVLEVMGPALSELDLDKNGKITSLELSAAKLVYGDNLRIAIAELNLGLLAPKGMVLEQVYDQTDYINSAKSLVEGNIWVGGTLAFIVLMVFLRDWRSVFVVGVSIPISVIGTFLFIKGLGRSINVISLAGMAFAVGMVVDNAIVVLENIYRRYQMGEPPDEAAANATNEVWGAVLASTLTTLAVFIPIIFLQGQVGQLFRDIAIAISCAVGLSLIVSVTVVPTLARRMLKRNPKGGETPGSFGLFGLVKLAGYFNDAVANSIDWLQNCAGNVFIRALIVATFAVASIGGAWLLQPKMEYLPEGNRNLIIAILLPPPGYNVDHMINIGRQIEADISPYWEAAPGSPEAAELAGPPINNFFFVARGRSLFMGASCAEPLRSAELIPIFSAAAGKIPGMIPIVSQASLFESALGGGRNIDIEITGPDLEKLVGLGGKVFGMCMQEFPMTEGNQLRPIPSLDLSSPELHVLPRWERAADLGVSAQDLGFSVDALLDGAFVGDYWHEGRKIDLILYGADEFSRHSQDVGDLPISTPTGELVTLSAVADVKKASGPEQVNHIERLRAITIQVKPRPGMPLESALQTIEDKIRKPMMESSEFQDGQYQIRLAGTADKLNETQHALQGNLLLALLITYLLMAGLFESFMHPLVVMLSVALALVGGFGGLAVLNLVGQSFSDKFTAQPMDTLTMLGFVILIGTVVNNAILIVHQSLNYIKDEKLPYKEAIVKSTRTRIRPIFMSTMTTVLGMLPLVLPNPVFHNWELHWEAGAGSELYRGLGSVVLGGMIVSTVFTLVLVPIAFSLSLDLKFGLSRLLGWKNEFDTASDGVPAASVTEYWDNPENGSGSNGNGNGSGNGNGHHPADKTSPKKTGTVSGSTGHEQ